MRRLVPWGRTLHLEFGLVLAASSLTKLYGSGAKKDVAFVGFARLITDGTTFAYMTDVGILRKHQGKGLGRFLMGCVHEVISSWPHLRRFMLLAADSMDLYRKTLGVQDSRDFSESIGVGMLDGPSGKHPDH